MIVQMQGVITGKRIELEREPDLPSGSNVIVRIQPKLLTLEEKRQMVDLLCGTWAGDASEDVAEPAGTAGDMLRSPLFGLWSDRDDIRDSMEILHNAQNK